MRLTTLLLRSRSYEAWNILIQKVGTDSQKKLDFEVGALPKNIKFEFVHVAKTKSILEHFINFLHFLLKNIFE